VIRVALCAIVRNEAPYLPEWLDWHRRMGVSRFLIYDNVSTDDTVAVLAPYDDVEVKAWPGGKAEDAQRAAYWDCLTTFARRRTHNWLAIIDADEYLWHPNGDTLPQVIARYDAPDCHGLWAPWRMFGWGPHATRPTDGTIQSYLWRGPEDYAEPAPIGGKSIVRLGLECRVQSPHWILIDGWYELDSGLLTNHYYTRSREEAYQRRVVMPREDFGAATWDVVKRAGDECSVIFDDRLARLAKGAERALCG
jgi:hypothetical protein